MGRDLPFRSRVGPETRLPLVFRAHAAWQEQVTPPTHQQPLQLTAQPVLLRHISRINHVRVPSFSRASAAAGAYTGDGSVMTTAERV